MLRRNIFFIFLIVFFLGFFVFLPKEVLAGCSWVMGGPTSDCTLDSNCFAGCVCYEPGGVGNIWVVGAQRIQWSGKCVDGACWADFYTGETCAPQDCGCPGGLGGVGSKYGLVCNSTITEIDTKCVSPTSSSGVPSGIFIDYWGVSTGDDPATTWITEQDNTGVGGRISYTPGTRYTIGPSMRGKYGARIVLDGVSGWQPVKCAAWYRTGGVPGADFTGVDWCYFYVGYGGGDDSGNYFAIKPVTAPTCTISGPSSITEGSSGTFTATATGYGDTVRRIEIWRAQTNDNNPPGTGWQQIGGAAYSESGVSSSTRTWSVADFDLTGYNGNKWWVVCDAYYDVNGGGTNTTRCTGNPFGVPSDWGDCWSGNGTDSKEVQLNKLCPTAPPWLNSSSPFSEGDDNITLSWGNVSNETGYKIERSGSVVDTRGVDVTTYTDSNAKSCPNYTYRVAATKSGCPDAWSVSRIQSQSINAPSNISCSFASNQITLGWTDYSRIENQFNVQRKTYTGGAWSAWSDWNMNVPQYTVSDRTQTGNVPTMTDNICSLPQPPTQVQYQVRARRTDLGCTSSYVPCSQATVNCCFNSAPTTPALSSPVDKADCQSSTTLTLSWSPPSSWGVCCSGQNNRYFVYRDNGNQNPTSLIANLDSGTTSYTMSNLSRNTTYSWKVVASNGCLSTPPSTYWTFTTAPAQPGAPTLTVQGCGCATGLDQNCIGGCPMSWTTIPGLTYALRIDDLYPSWLGNCASPDICLDNLLWTNNSYNLTGKGGHNYQAWVHAVDRCSQWSSVPSCPSPPCVNFVAPYLSCSLSLSPNPLNVVVGSYGYMAANVNFVRNYDSACDAYSVGRVSFTPNPAGIVTPTPASDNTSPYGTNIYGNSAGSATITGRAYINPGDLDIGCAGTASVEVINPPPWFRTQGGDSYALQNLTVYIPVTATDKNYCLEQDGDPGVVSSGEGTLSFNAGQASEENWQAISNFNLSTYNWAYFYDKFDSPTTENCPNGGKFRTSNLPPAPPGGVTEIYYCSSSNVHLGDEDTGEGLSIPSGRKIVILSNGRNVLIHRDVTVASGGFLGVITNAKINIDAVVGQIEGFYTSDDEIKTGGGTSVFAGRGIFFAQDFTLNRDLDPGRTTGANLNPAEFFTFRPDLVINAPEEIRISTISWQEVAP